MLLPLQGEGLYALVPRALPWAGNWLPFQGAAGGFELIEFLQRGCGLRRCSLVGLRRRNNELNELTNCRAARERGIAPVRGSYSRIGACPYLPPVLIDSRCCPCKGRISWAGLAPQHLSRYEPLTGARSINRLQEVGASPYPKYEPPSGALARQVRISQISSQVAGHTGGPARAESPTSSEPRATPWVNVRTTPAPCKGKSKKQ